jgi:ketosteroid isomerase-like protein
MTRAVESSSSVASFASPLEHVYYAWDEALSRNDVNGLLALYAPDAILESPLVPHLMGWERPARGQAELRALFEKLAVRKPKARQFYRTGYLTDGNKLIWEYPQDTPKGQQMDFVEVMELNKDGLIAKHRVYWGWVGFGVLQRDEYHQWARPK